MYAIFMLVSDSIYHSTGFPIKSYSSTVSLCKELRGNIMGDLKGLAVDFLEKESFQALF